MAPAGAILPHQLTFPGYMETLEFLPHKVSYNWHYFTVYNIKGLLLDRRILLYVFAGHFCYYDYVLPFYYVYRKTKEASEAVLTVRTIYHQCTCAIMTTTSGKSFI